MNFVKQFKKIPILKSKYKHYDILSNIIKKFIFK